MLTGQRVEFLDHPKLLAQFARLARRTGATGKDAIDHVRGQHDDLSNAVAGLLVQIGKPRTTVREVRLYGF